ncbi:hypothetical protein BLOT_009279 [Blomia tropicalis]|nr:hypothetical protein BLOT_009279 [Blomia tropicalis]
MYIQKKQSNYARKRNAKIVYSTSKPKWLEKLITENCSFSLKNGIDLEMSKTLDELCLIYKLMNVTKKSERKTIRNCLLNDQWNNADNICKKWWIEPNHTTTEVTTENELGLYQFAKLVKSAINRSEKCLYELSHNNSETCEFLAKYNETILFSFRKRIYQKLVQRDNLDQRLVEHCFLYHQFDEFHECVGVSNGTHLNGFTMSKARQTRISLLWKEYQDYMFRCIKHFDDRNCIEKFDINKVCKHSSNQDCIQVMMCKYTSSWKTMPDHICYFLSRTKKFIPKTVCNEEKKGCTDVIFCKYTDSLQTTQGHICQMNTYDETYIPPRIQKMQREFYILENKQAKEDCNMHHQHIDDGICKKVETKVSVVVCSHVWEYTDKCPYCQTNELDIKEHDYVLDSCILYSLMYETEYFERFRIMDCLIDDDMKNSVNLCHKWWQETPIITQENLSEKEKANYRFTAIVKKIINMVEPCVYHLFDRDSEYCDLYENYGNTELRRLARLIWDKIVNRYKNDINMVKHCFYKHHFKDNLKAQKCKGISNATHMEGFIMSNARKTRIIQMWDSLVECLKYYGIFECLD